ncbi:MAG: DoxX family protein [Acidobacteriota bacterium]|nr:DoxX family protein [Acidobacteriota bacterium]
MFRRLLETAPVWFPLPVRLTLGLIFIAHGAQKVFGVWGGPGLAKFAAAGAPMGLRPAWLWMGAAALAELIGGVLVLAGLLTRVGAFLLASVMLVAMVGVHWSGGFFLPKGIEYTVALLGMALALMISGGGQVSADASLQNPSFARRR